MTPLVRFAHISDTHSKPLGFERSQRFADIVAEIRADDYDFVIHTGDLMEEPSAWAARAFKAVCSSLDVPVYFVPGNHDVYNPPMGEIEAPWWARLEVNSNLQRSYEGWFGPAWYKATCRGVHLVGVNSLVLNSGLPEEGEQWAWLEETLKEIDGHGTRIVLFTHLPLFVNQADERLDDQDFANRYLVVAPPARDRLLDLVRRNRVTAVLAGHLHVPWHRSQTWPDGSTTEFLCTGSSGPPSPMAIDHFGLPLNLEDGLGYHEHWLDWEGLRSLYHRHMPANPEGGWTLGPAWTCRCAAGQVPSTFKGKAWYGTGYLPSNPEWQALAPEAPLLLGGGGLDGAEKGRLFLRQTFEAEADAVAMVIELLTGRALEIYLNGELMCKLDRLEERPPAWQSADGTNTIDSPLLHLGLPQRLVHRGRNTLALWADDRPGPGWNGEETITFRKSEVHD
jgi:3',5'-cyclic AMP phosphodiesterase CpdA